jgi:hypothetical protein
LTIPPMWRSRRQIRSWIVAATFSFNRDPRVC